MKLAVTYGRFNYLSKGHIHFFEKIVEVWKELYIVVLINNNKIIDKIMYDETNLNDFIVMCNANVNKKKLLAIHHRLNCLSRAIQNNSKLIGKVHISAFCRPEVNVKKFNLCYPPDAFDLVFPLDDSNEWDKIKPEMFSGVFFRPVRTVELDFLTHNSDIVANNAYKELLEESAYNYYLTNKLI